MEQNSNSQTKLMHHIERLQSVNCLAVDLMHAVRGTADRLLGLEPAEPVVQKEGRIQGSGDAGFNGELEQMDIALCSIDTNLRDALEAMTRLSTV